MTAAGQPEPFFDNPAIAFLGQAERWTVSDRNKRPLDMRGIIERQQVVGAPGHGPDVLVDLPTVRATIPDAVNSCFWIDAPTDGYMVLDIEPTCPVAVRDKLLAMPAAYRERSMSGHGFHLVMELPGNFEDFPHASSRTKLRHPQGWYEVLLNHWCTFTHDVVDAPRTTSSTSTTPEAMWAELASTTPASSPTALSGMVSMDSTTEPPLDATVADRLVAQVLEDWNNPVVAASHKEPADYHNDMSRWEFATMHKLFAVVCRRASQPEVVAELSDDPMVCDQQLVWVLWQATTSVLPHRDKHDGQRHRMPYLMAQAAKVVASYPREERTAA